MRTRVTPIALAIALSISAAPPTVQALDLTFLDQAPIRFLNDADLELLEEAAAKALDEGEIGQSIDWNNDQTGNSGTVTPSRAYSRQGNDCRRLKVVSRAAKATRGSAENSFEFCRIDGTWKILTVAR